MAAKRTFSDDLRRAIEQCGKTRYRIGLEAGVDQAVLCKFMQGERGMSLASIEKLYAYLGLRLVAEHKPRKKRKGG